MKIIRPRLHGILDYCTIIFLYAAPWLFSFGHSDRLITYGIATAQLVLTICTDYPAGLLHKIPFLMHGFIEMAMSFGLAIIAIWFLYEGLDTAKIVYWCLAVVYLSVFLLTNFNKSNQQPA